MPQRPPLIRRLFTNLTFLVLVALVAAVLLGYFYPAEAIKTEKLGVWFITVIKWFIPPIVFLTIVSGISGMSNLKKVAVSGSIPSLLRSGLHPLPGHRHFDGTSCQTRQDR